MSHGVPPELFQDEIARLSLMELQQRPEYAGLALSEPAGPEEITLTEVEEAVSELAERRGERPEVTWCTVRALAGGQRDAESLASAVVTLARQPEAGVLALSSAELTEAQRRELARHDPPLALPDGSYPVPDLVHLRRAAVLAASGHGDAEAARKLIRRRAAELGVPLHTLAGFGEAHEDGSMAATVALVADNAGDAGEVGLSAGFGSADDIARRNPELLRVKVHRSGAETSGRAVKPGEPATTRNRAHAAAEEHASDTRQPARGGVVHPEVARYLRELHDPRFMGGRTRKAGGPERPHGSVVVHPYRGGRR